MAVNNLYSNLPGHLVEFRDGGLQLTTSATDTSSTKSILILGTAFDGPINEPVKIDETTVSQVFGNEVDENGYPNGATLTKYAKQAFKNGFDDVRCMRVTGSQAYTTVQADDEVISYNTKQEAIDGSELGDVQGKIFGNLRYDFKYAEWPGNTDYIFPKNKNGFTISKNADNDDISTDASKFIVAPYEGLAIADDSILPSDSLTLTISGAMQFIKKTAEDSEASGVIRDVAANSTVFASVSVNNESKATVDAEDGANFFFDNADTQTPIPYLPNTGTGVKSVTFKKTIQVPDPDSEDPEATIDKNVEVNIDLDEIIINPTASAITMTLPGQVEFEGENVDTAEGTVEVETYQYITNTNVVVITGDGTDATIDFPESYVQLPDPVVNVIEDIQVTEVITDKGYVMTSDQYQVSNGKVVIVGFDGVNPGDVLIVKYTYKEAVVNELKLKVKSQWGGEIYKNATVEITKEVEETRDDEGNVVDSKTYTVLTFTRPESKKGGSFSYSSKYYRTVDDLVLAMKNDFNNLNMFEIEIVKGEGTDSIDKLVAIPATPLSQGGENGVNVSNNEMFIALSGDRYKASDIGHTINENSAQTVTADMVGYLKTQGAYQILENYNVDYIYPAGIYADSVQTVNPNSDFQRELALVCYVLTYRTKMTHGFIDVKPNSNTTLVGIDNYVAGLINGRSNQYYMIDNDGNPVLDSEENPIDIGWYTSAVVGPEPVMQSPKLGTYYGSPAIAYAALNAVLEPASAPTNKPLRNVQGMKFKFSNKQMDALCGARYVVFKLKNEGVNSAASSTPYVVDGITAGNANCDYAEITTVKIVQDVVDQIREVADPFIGEKNTPAQRNALSALISKRLSKLVELEEIQSYTFEVQSTLQQQLLGEATIALELVPAFILRKITTVVALRAGE